MKNFGAAFLFVVCGLLLSIPYCRFSGSSDHVNVLMTSIIASLTVFVIWKLRIRAVLLLIVTYWCLPVIFNRTSVVLNSLGYKRAGQWFFDNRYMSLIGCLAAGIVILVVGCFIADQIERIRRPRSTSE